MSNCGINTGLPISGATGGFYFKTRDFCSDNFIFNSQINTVITAPATTDFNATAKTITATTGNFVTNGFVAGQPITITDSINNNKIFTISIVTETVITVIEDTIVDETDTTDVTITGDSSIKDSNLPFNVIGYIKDDLITISGSSNNDDIYTVTGTSDDGQYLFISAVSFTVAENDTGTEITMKMPAPGRAIAGVQNWEISYETSTTDTSTFDSGKYSEFTPIRESWSGSADKLKIFGKSINIYKGKKMRGVFFERWESLPTTSEPALYWEGDVIITGITITNNNNEVIGENLSFQGSGELGYTIKNSAWTTASA